MAEGTRRRTRIPPLTGQQRYLLKAIAARDSAALARRARLVLLAADNPSLPVSEIAAVVGLSKSRVWYWLRRYRMEAMEIFGSDQSAFFQQEVPTLFDPERTDEAAPGGAITVTALCSRYSVDMAHARHIMGMALMLFDATTSLHRLPPEAKSMLEAGAMLHNVAYEIDPEQHLLLGRDIVLKHPLQGFSDAERRIIACMTAFHSRKVTPEDEPVFNVLQPKRQADTLALTALLRVADGLDYSHTQTTTITDVLVNDDGGVVITVEGAYADYNAARSDKVADVWRDFFGTPIVIREAYPVEAVRKDFAWAQLEPDMGVIPAGRLLLAHYLEQVEQHAGYIREDEHDVVPYLERDLARLEGVLKVFGKYFDATALAGYRKDVRWLYHSVETVLVSRAASALTRPLPEMIEPEPEFAPGFNRADEVLRDRHKKACKKLKKALESKRYRKFVTGLLGFSRDDAAGVFAAGHTHVTIGVQAPLLVWEVFTRLRGEGRSVKDEAVQWRYVRRFHDVLHYLGALLGDELTDLLTVIQPLEVQLHEIVLGQAVLDAMLDLTETPPKSAGKKRHKRHRSALPGLEALVAAHEDWLEAACAEAVPLWDALDSVAFRQKLALATASP